MSGGTGKSTICFTKGSEVSSCLCFLTRRFCFFPRGLGYLPCVLGLSPLCSWVITCCLCVLACFLSFLNWFLCCLHWLLRFLLSFLFFSLRRVVLRNVLLHARVETGRRYGVPSSSHHKHLPIGCDNSSALLLSQMDHSPPVESSSMSCLFLHSRRFAAYPHRGTHGPCEQLLGVPSVSNILIAEANSLMFAGPPIRPSSGHECDLACLPVPQTSRRLVCVMITLCRVLYSCAMISGVYARHGTEATTRKGNEMR